MPVRPRSKCLLVFFTARIRPKTAGDIMLLSRSGKFEPKPLVATPTYEGGAQLSPDGR